MKRQTTFIQLPSAPMQAIYNTIRRVAGSNIPFLITGENGVGKEGVARYIKVVPDATNLLSLSTVIDSPQNSGKVNSLDTKQEPLRVQSFSVEVHLK